MQNVIAYNSYTFPSGVFEKQNVNLSELHTTCVWGSQEKHILPII